jgi:hydrogenase-4 component E
MSVQTAIDGVLVMVLLLNLALLAAGRLATCIRIFAGQCLVMAFLPLAGELIHDQAIGIHTLLLVGGLLGLKAYFIPWLLMRTIRTGEIHREVEPFIGFTTSVVLGAGMIAGSFALGARLHVPGHPMSHLLVPTALSTLMIGLLLIVSRVKAISQVLGYLVLENGIFLFGLTLVQQMPLLVEMGILLDVLVGVFVMAVLVYHIRREFDHMDTDELSQLKEN